MSNNKTGDIAKVSAKGSLHVMWGLVVSSIISSVGAIFIARLLGSDLYGLYTIVLTIPAFIQIFRDWGMTFAMIRFAAQYRAEGRVDEIRSVYLSGVLFEIVLSLILLIISFSFSDLLAINVFNRPAIGPLIRIVSLSILAGGLISAASSVFTGFDRLELNSIMIICQSVFKTAIVIALVILGLGTSGAIIGYTAGFIGAGLIGLVLIIAIYRLLPKPFSGKYEIKAYLTAMLAYGLPLSIATLITSFLPQFYAFLLPIHYATDNIQIGNYAVAMNFIVLIGFVVTPVTTMIFPAFSKFDLKKDLTPLRDIFRLSVKYSSLVVVPFTALVMCLSGLAVSTLFGDSYSTAGFYLALFSIQYLYVAFGNLSLSGLLNGQGKTSFVLKMAILTGLVGFPLGYFLISSLGVTGLIISTLVSNLPSLFWGLFFIKKNYNIAVDLFSSLKILLASAITAISTFGIVSQLSFAVWIRLLLGTVVFLIILIPTFLITRSITRSDVANLRFLFKGIAVIGTVTDKLLNFLEKIMTKLKIN